MIRILKYKNIKWTNSTSVSILNIGENLTENSKFKKNQIQFSHYKLFI